MKNIIILTSKKKNALFTGEEEFYKQILLSIEKKGAKGYILPLADSNNRSAYYWDPTINRWLSTSCPRPSIVYNRYPRKDPESDIIINYLDWLEKEKIPYFNKHFFDKVKITNLFQRNKCLRYFLPATQRLISTDELRLFLAKYPTIFLKDSEGSQGKGIWKIKRIGNYYTLMSQKKQYDHLRFNQLSKLLHVLMKKRRLLMQQAIPSQRVNNVPYDFRVLMLHYNNRWALVGIGVRAAIHGGFTTHVPQGGIIISPADVPTFPSPFKVKKIGNQLGRMLQINYSHVKEFSFDIVMDTSNQLWIVDVNSKPMSFDEVDIQKRRTDYLSDILLQTE